MRPSLRFASLVFVLGALSATACGSDATPAGTSNASDAGTGDARPDLGSDVVGDGAGDAAGDAAGEAARDAAGAEDGSQEADAASPVVPTEREVVIPLDGQVLFPVHLDGAPETYHLVIDTGAVRSAFDETLLRDVENGVGVATVDFGDGIVFEDYEVLAADLAEAEDHIGVPIHGLIGQDLFQQLYFGVDYRRARAVVSRTPPSSAPSGWTNGQRHILTYEMVQGFPVVTIDIDGAPARLIADTGSGVTLLTQSHVPPAWLAAGLEGYVWHTSYGSDEATIVRVPSMGLGGVTVEDSWAVVVPDEHHLAAVFEAIGLQVDGFLGYPVYRSFYWGIRGGESEYEIYPQQGEDPWTATEWNRVGVELVRSGDAVLVDMLFHPSTAYDAGVLVGDTLLGVDGVSSDGMGLDDVRLLLRGAVGQPRTLEIERDGASMQVQVDIDGLLP